MNDRRACMSELGHNRKSVTVTRMSACSHKETFVGTLDARNQAIGWLRNIHLQSVRRQACCNLRRSQIVLLAAGNSFQRLFRA